MTAPAAVWRGMNRAELDAAYDNLAAVPDGAARLRDHAARSAVLRGSRPGVLDIPYGPGPRNRIDLFACGRPDAPLLAFIHGGYWQRNAKETFADLAEGPWARGLDVAMIGYTLAPDANLTAIVAEVRDAVRILRETARCHGFGARRLVVSGWSAGAHLAAMTMDDPEVDAILCISGIFDLEPIRLGVLNHRLRLTAEEVRDLSPLRLGSERAPPVVLAYGTAELPELQRQSRDYHVALLAAGLPATLMPVDGADHFSILNELARQDGALAATAGFLAGRS